MKGGGKALWKDENIADSLTTHAIQFIEENKDKPFFLYFATMMYTFLVSPMTVLEERTQWD